MDQYFNKLNTMLRSYKRAVPSLLIDLDILDRNIEILNKKIPEHIAYRIVVKSLPSLELINYIADRIASNRLMVFHQPFLSEIVKNGRSDYQILLGKPMPIKTAGYFFETIADLQSSFNINDQIEWLVDTEQRVQQYIDLARTINRNLKLNLEIDVGLHRGGFDNIQSLSDALMLIRDNQDWVRLSGLMGYDPHVAKVPSILRSRKKLLEQANTFYKQCKSLIQSEFQELWSENLTFNGAGSPTIELHQSSTPLNDVSAGSCLVKPTDFDIDTLEAYTPAAFIATPILKKLNGTTIPGLEGVQGLMRFLRPALQNAFFIYGGFWKAKYHYPKGLRSNTLYGESTNQTMVNLPSGHNLDVDDFIFLRPHQSEYLFLHFGKILAYRNFEISAEWEVLPNE